MIVDSEIEMAEVVSECKNIRGSVLLKLRFRDPSGNRHTWSFPLNPDAAKRLCLEMVEAWGKAQACEYGMQVRRAMSPREPTEITHTKQAPRP